MILDTGTTTADNGAILLAVLAAFTAAAGLFYTGLTYRQAAKAQYLQTINDFDAELTSLENSQERNTDFPSFAAKYLNLHDRMAYLALKDVIPQDIAGYFDNNFGAALALLKLPPYQHYQEDLGYLTKWCEKKKIKPGQPPLPYDKGRLAS